MGVRADTTMIKDVATTFKRYDRTTMSLQIPQCLEQLKGSDASFEMVVSNTLQPLRLIHTHNVVTRSIAVILVHTELKGTPYDGAVKTGAIYEKLFKEVLQFDKVTVHTDLKKTQVKAVLASLEKEANAFEKTKSDNEILSIAIANVGYYLDLVLSTTHIAHFEKECGIVKAEVGADKSVYDERFPITSQGEPI